MRDSSSTSRTPATRWLLASVMVAALGVTPRVLLLAAPQAPGSDQQSSQSPIFRSGVTLVTTDVIVRDENGQFVSDLQPDDFVVSEDDVQQQVSSLVLVHGGRVFDLLAPPPRPVQEGLILPEVRPVDDTAGRIFIIFVDDLHLAASLTPKVRKLFGTIAEELIHEGDLFGIISSGTSSLSVDLTYDRKLLKASAQRIIGGGINPDELLQQASMGAGLGELRWRVHVAFKAARETLKNLERINNRRKVFIYISSGYDFDPFGEQFSRERGVASQYDPIDQADRRGSVFSDAELHFELAELAQAANRANATFHTLDPRGLMAASDAQYNLPARAWGNHLFRTQSSLRTIAELTGGMAIVNRNSFVAGLRDIDAETSDYYVLGFYTNIPNVEDQRTRQLKVEVGREGVVVRSRDEYTFDRLAIR